MTSETSSQYMYLLTGIVVVLFALSFCLYFLVPTARNSKDYRYSQNYIDISP